MKNRTMNLDTSAILYAMQQRNLVYNYNFLNFSNKELNNPIVYNNPDGWIYKDAGNGGQLTFDEGKKCCRIVKSQGDDVMTFTQAIHEFPRSAQILSGETVTATAVIGAGGSAATVVQFSITDGLSTDSHTFTIKPDEVLTTSIELTVDASATELIVSVNSTTANTVIEVYKVYANIGSVAIETLPCMVEEVIGERKQYMSIENPPATELSLCAESAELCSSYTRLSAVLNGKFGTGDNGRSILPDMRGYFSRAWDNGAAIDPDADQRTAWGQGKVTGDHVGTVEGDEFKEHNHDLVFKNTSTIPVGTQAATNVLFTTVPSNTEDTGGKETRSKNIAELYTIKWA